MELLIGAMSWLFVEVIVGVVFYSIGWAVLKTVTLGRYPGPWRGVDSLIGAEWVAVTGLLVTVAAAFVVLKLP